MGSAGSADRLTISEVEILPVRPQGGLVAFASFVLNRQFYVGNVAIRTRPTGGYRLVFPDKTLPNGKVIQCFHPITRDATDALERAVIGRFEALTAGAECGDVGLVARQPGGWHGNGSRVP
jgi:DNA-binding cell septation regulator SpoVG